MNVVVPLLGALGLLLMFQGLTTSTQAPRVPRWRSHLDELARSSGVRGVTGTRLVLASVGSWLIATILTAGLTGSIVISLCIGIGALWLPFGYVRSRAVRRRASLREEWPDVLAGLISSVRSGMSLAEACTRLEARAPDGLKPGFASFASSYRATGSFPASLHRMQDVLSDPIADKVIAALSVAYDVGGSDLVRLLRTLSDFIREDLRVRKEIEARWSWTVTAARVAAGAPFVVLILMALRPEAARAYGSFTGAMVLVIGSAATCVGYRMMLKIGRLPEDRRSG